MAPRHSASPKGESAAIQRWLERSPFLSQTTISSQQSNQMRGSERSSRMKLRSDFDTERPEKSRGSSKLTNTSKVTKSSRKANSRKAIERSKLTRNGKRCPPNLEGRSDPDRTIATRSEELRWISATEEGSTLLVNETVGDLFNAPTNSILIHACNCHGAWGGGIAETFKRKYRPAFHEYENWCDSYQIEQLIGTAFITQASGKGDTAHYVGCLFTSRSHGTRRDSPREILKATGSAMTDLLQQITTKRAEGLPIADIRMCKINSGLFNVPWEDTKRVLEGLKVSEGMPASLTVYTKAS